MICTNCGNDDAAEGHEWCADCLEPFQVLFIEP